MLPARQLLLILQSWFNDVMYFFYLIRYAYRFFTCQKTEPKTDSLYRCTRLTAYQYTRLIHICRAIRFQIVLARTMTNHSMYFSRGRPPHISAVFAQSFCYSETPVGVGHVNQIEINRKIFFFRNKRSKSYYEKCRIYISATNLCKVSM